MRRVDVTILGLTLVTCDMALKRLQFLRLALSGVIWVFAVSCDRGYPPIIANEYDVPIEISISFVGSAYRFSGTLPARTQLVQWRKGLEIEEIRVTLPSGQSRAYGPADLATARSKRKDSVDVWILSAQGLKLGDERELRELGSRRRH